MHTILQKLVMLQDLDYMISEITSKDGKKIQKKMGLTIKGKKNCTKQKWRLSNQSPRRFYHGSIN